MFGLYDLRRYLFVQYKISPTISPENRSLVDNLSTIPNRVVPCFQSVDQRNSTNYEYRFTVDLSKMADS